MPNALFSSRHVWILLAGALGCASGSNAPPTAPIAAAPSTAAAAPAPSPSAADYKVVGYFTNWVENRKGCEFHANDVDVTAFTHINFAFAEVSPGPGGKQKPSWSIVPFGSE